MIPLSRPPLDAQLTARLDQRTARLARGRVTTETARKSWTDAAQLRRQLRAALVDMAPGIERCMYCGDNQGSSIDHFQPLALAPLKAFAWVNHLLACTHCNSNHKRDRYPVDPATGHCLLVDPTSEDPADHLDLVLTTGVYRPLRGSPKGAATIEVFGLDRPSLERGRAKAFVRCRSMLRDLDELIRAADGGDDGDAGEAAEVADALRVQPFADVLHAMRVKAEAPGAAAVMGAREIHALLWLDGAHS